MTRVGQAALPACLTILIGLSWSCARPNVKLEVTSNRPPDWMNAGGPVIAGWKTRNAIAWWRWFAGDARPVIGVAWSEAKVSGKRGVHPKLSATLPKTANNEGLVASGGIKEFLIRPHSEVPETLSKVAEPGGSPQFKSKVTTVYFDSNRADLNLSEQRKLVHLAQWLLGDALRIGLLQIDGNCDQRGTEAYRLGMGGRRARQAKEFLAGFGIDEYRIEIVGYKSVKACERRDGSTEIVPPSGRDRRLDSIYLGKRLDPTVPFALGWNGNCRSRCLTLAVYAAPEFSSHPQLAPMKDRAARMSSLITFSGRLAP